MGGGQPQDNVHLLALAEYLHRHVRNSSLNIVAGQGRFGGMGSLLEAGLARFLEPVDLRDA